MSITPNEDDFISWEKACIKFEDAVYDALHEREDLPQLITRAFDVKTLYRSGSTKIGDDESIVPSAKDVVYHLATLASVPTSKFYNAWFASVDAFNEDAKAKRIRPLVSIYGQEYAGRQVIAQALNPTLFNDILKEMSDNADIDEHYPLDKNKDINPYLKHKPNL